MPDFLTVADVASMLQCSRHHVRHLLDHGMPHIDLGTSEKRIPRIPRAAFEQWLRDRTERKD